jgi:copper resistance protein B
MEAALAKRARRSDVLRWATLAAVAASGAAHAQRLEYRDVASWPVAAAPPRLRYEPLDDVAPAPAAVAVSAAVAAGAAEAGTGAVREFYLDQMELALQRGDDGYAWDVAARLGGPRHRLWLASVGDGTLGGSLDYLEMQALYSRAVSENWDVQAGLRYDIRPSPNRAWLTIGAQGNASEALYLGAFAFLSHRGELSGRLFALYDIPVAGRLTLQPSAEIELFSEDIPSLGIGAGPAFGEAALRLRYEIRPWLAPYAGIVWERSFGRTARMAREAGDDVRGRAVLIGLRSWF